MKGVVTKELSVLSDKHEPSQPLPENHQSIATSGSRSHVTPGISSSHPPGAVKQESRNSSGINEMNSMNGESIRETSNESYKDPCCRHRKND